MSDDIFDNVGRVGLDPFRPIDLTIEYVSAAAGKQKSRTMIKQSVDAAVNRGVKRIISVPTLDLKDELMAFARECDPDVKLYEIVSEPKRRSNTPGVGKRIKDFIMRFHRSNTGLLLFTTIEGLFRVAEFPPETAAFDLIIDEEPQIILTREPFKLRYDHWVLTRFLDINAIPTTIAERNLQIKPPPEFIYNDPDYKSDKDFVGTNQKTDQNKLEVLARMLELGIEDKDQEQLVLKAAKELVAKRDAWETWLANKDNLRINGEAKSYYLLTAKEDFNQKDPLWRIKLMERGINVDDIFRYLDPIPRWLLHEAALFTDMSAWNAMTVKPDPENPIYNRGEVNIIGLFRPDILKAFSKVTMMAALFEYTTTYMVWKSLGVKFVRSREIDLDDQTTHLGKRKLNIYWLYDEGWSIKRKDDSGGIEPILNLIKQSGVIAADAEVCVVLNKEDGGPENPAVIHKAFPKAIPMPHNSRGQNRFRHYHQLIHLAALNSHTRDIKFMDSVLGIDADQQRIARTGQEVYQTAMRISLREPSSTHDVDIIVADKAIAEWMVRWFEPSNQVSVFEIDSSGVIKRKGKPGRPKIDKPLTQVERNRRYRQKKKNLETHDQ